MSDESLSNPPEGGFDLDSGTAALDAIQAKSETPSEDSQIDEDQHPGEVDEEEELETSEEEETEDSDEEDPEEEDTDEASDSYEIDGDTFTVEQLVELKKSGIRQDDYTQKTQALAEDRTQAKALIEKTVEYHQQMDQKLAEAEQFLAQQWQTNKLTEAEMSELKMTDPEAYLLAVDDENQSRTRLQAVFTERKRLQDSAQESQNALTQEYIQNAYSALTTPEEPLYIDGYADPERGQVIRTDVQAVANEYGFSQEELNTIHDPRMFKLVHDLVMLRSETGDVTEKKKLIAQKKLKKRVTHINRPGSPTSKNQQLSKSRRKILSQQKASGNDEDTLAALNALTSRR